MKGKTYNNRTKGEKNTKTNDGNRSSPNISVIRQMVQLTAFNYSVQTHVQGEKE